jgi:hypothetical protein
LNRRRVLLCAALLATLALPFWVWAKERDMGKGQELQNVEVMDKSMSLVDARKYMMAFNEALTVQCRDCHDLRDFAKDVNEMKLEARRMMKMTKEINEEFFGGQEKVTCFTCHGGKLKPLTELKGVASLSDSTAARRP